MKNTVYVAYSCWTDEMGKKDNETHKEYCKSANSPIIDTLEYLTTYACFPLQR